MAKYHISTDGNPRVCKASAGSCPIGGNETHYTSKEAARTAFEASEAIPESTPKKTRSGESIRTADYQGNVYWRNAEGKLHRDGDLPAFEGPNGTKEWYRNGQLHRDGGLPAIEWANGARDWYQNGQRHRDGDLPAIEYADGTKEWWFNGKFQYRVLPDGTRINALKPS